jgi:hypothetical protein
VVNLFKLDPRLFETVAHGIVREPRVVLLASKPLFLSCRNDLSVQDESGRAVVVKRRDSKDSHDTINLEQGVDEWSDDRSFGQHNQATENGHHHHNWQQPEFLSIPHE